jgi:hypothetical protein
MSLDTVVRSRRDAGSPATYRYAIENESYSDIVRLRIGENPDSEICELESAPRGWDEETGMSSGTAGAPDGWTLGVFGDEGAEADRWCLEFAAPRGRWVASGAARDGFSVQTEAPDDTYLTGFYAVWFTDGSVRRGPLHPVGRTRPPRKPIDEHPVWVSHPALPATPAGKAAAAAAVIVARSNGRRNEPPRGGTLGSVRTLFSFEILEIIKSHAALGRVGDSLAVRLAGGDVEHPSRIERARLADSTPIDPAGVYVLFLQEGRTPSELWPAAGDGGLYKISSGLVESVAHGFRSHDGITAEDFLSTLRKAASSR